MIAYPIRFDSHTDAKGTIREEGSDWRYWNVLREDHRSKDARSCELIVASNSFQEVRIEFSHGAYNPGLHSQRSVVFRKSDSNL